MIAEAFTLDRRGSNCLLILFRHVSEAMRLVWLLLEDFVGHGWGFVEEAGVDGEGAAVVGGVIDDGADDREAWGTGHDWSIGEGCEQAFLGLRANGVAGKGKASTTICLAFSRSVC